MLSLKSFAGNGLSVLHQILNIPYRVDFTSIPMSTDEGVELVRSFYSSSTSCILEYGSGNSTIYAIQNQKSIVSVETDFIYFRELCNYLHQVYPAIFSSPAINSREPSYIVFSSRCKQYSLLWINVGITGRYGIPLFKSNEKIEELCRFYLGNVYELFSDFLFDKILIDGRWRKACFFNVIKQALSAKSCPSILIDDCNDLSRGLYEAVVNSGLPHKAIDSLGRLVLAECDSEYVNIQSLDRLMQANLYDSL